MTNVFDITIDKAIDIDDKKGRLVFKCDEEEYSVLVLVLSDEDPFSDNHYIAEEIRLFLKDKISNTDKVLHFPVVLKTTGELVGPLPNMSRANIEKSTNHAINALNKVVEALSFYEEIEYKLFYKKVREFILSSNREEFLNDIFEKGNSIMGETYFSQSYSLIKRKSFNLDIFQKVEALIDKDDEKKYWELRRLNDDIKISIEVEHDKILVHLYKSVANNVIMKQYYPIDKEESISGLIPVFPIREIALDIRKTLLLYIPEKELIIRHYNLSQGILKNEAQFEFQVISCIDAYLLSRRRRIHGTFWDFGMKEILTREIPEGYIK